MRRAVHRLDQARGELRAAEEILATILSIPAIVVPIVVAALIILLTVFVIRLLWRRANLSAAARGG